MKEKLPPRQQSVFFVLSYMVETRQTYSQPEISFNYLSKRGFGWSHLDVGGGGDGDDGGNDGGAGGPGLLDFCENKNPISYQLIICIRLA